MTAQVIPGEAFLYLVEFTSHGVKVGISINPTRRIQQHRRDASAYGLDVGRTWVSPMPHGNARANESAIKGTSRREYLSRSFDDCVSQAEGLPMIRLDSKEVSARIDRTTDFLKSLVLGGAR